MEKVIKFLCARKNSLIFLFGSTILFLSITTPTTIAYYNRAVPIELDDSAAYIQRAVQFSVCPKQDCKALEDLIELTSESTQDLEISFSRRDIFERAILNHIPLYSYTMSVFYDSKNPENLFKVYFFFKLFIALLTTISIGIFIYSFFGGVVAGLTCFIVAFTSYFGQGLLALVPGVLGWCFIFTAIAIDRVKNRISIYFSPFLTFLSCFSHVSGKIYAVVFIIYLLSDIKQRAAKKKDFISVLLCVLIVCVAFSVPYFFDRPIMGHSILPTLEVNWVKGIVDNVFSMKHDVIDGVQRIFLNIILMPISIGFLVFYLDKKKRNEYLVLLFLMGGVCVTSLGYIHNGYPGDLVKRVWVPFSILTIGALAVLLVSMMNILVKEYIESRGRLSFYKSDRYALTAKGWGLFVVVAFVFVMSGNLLYNLGRSSLMIYNKTIQMTYRQDYKINYDKIRKITNNCGDIVINHKDPLLTFFVLGGLKCNVIYTSGLEKKEKYPQNPMFKNIKYGISRNPMGEDQGWHKITNENDMKINIENRKNIYTLYLKIKNTGKKSNIMIADGQNTVNLFVKPSNSWVELDVSSLDFSKEIIIKSASNEISLGGIRFDKNSLLNWPWDQNVNISFKRIFPDGMQYDVSYLLDSKSVWPFIDLKVSDDDSGFLISKL